MKVSAAILLKEKLFDSVKNFFKRSLNDCVFYNLLLEFLDKTKQTEGVNDETIESFGSVGIGCRT